MKPGGSKSLSNFYSMQKGPFLPVFRPLIMNWKQKKYNTNWRRHWPGYRKVSVLFS